jgi:hypothetical protein
MHHRGNEKAKQNRKSLFAGVAFSVICAVGVMLSQISPFSLIATAYAGPGPNQVKNTPTMSAFREFTQTGGPGLPNSQSSTGSGSLSIGQSSGPSSSQQLFGLLPTPNTAYVSPGGSTGTAAVSLVVPVPSTPVRVCADGFVDADGRPIVGVSVGQQYLWTGSDFIPDYATYAGTMIQKIVTSPNLTTASSSYTANDTFNWITTGSALQTNWGSVNDDTFWASIQINTNQTIAFLQAGLSGNCEQLLNACQSDNGSTAIDPNTISTNITKIGGPDCVNYYGQCHVSQLIKQSGNMVMTSTANPQGTTPGGCQVFPSQPTCNQVLPLFQKYAPLFSCSCLSQSQTPFCQVYCPNILTAWQIDMRPTATCSCASQTAVGAPNCTQNCLGQLPGVQSAKGNGYTCTCTPNNTNTAPNCQPNCGGLQPTFQAKYPDYSYLCLCPSGTAVVTNPVCVPTCLFFEKNQQTALGANYTCSCQDPRSTTEQPSCPMNCGGYMATQPNYQTNANQVCSCPSGNSSVTTPSCVPTCGALQPTWSCPSGQVATCPNGNTNPGTPTCVQQ